MSFKIEDWLFSTGSRLLAEATTDGDHAEDAHGDDHGDGHFGVHITYDALFASVAFLAVVWSLGKFTQTFLKMPSVSTLPPSNVFAKQLLPRRTRKL